MKIKAF